ncbi:MFS transporter [Microlunatus parietis]
MLCGAQFMLVVDTTIVALALPLIDEQLGFGSPASLQLVVSLYALTLGGSLIVAGRAADLAGPKPAFIAGLVLFTVASVGCGLALEPWHLLTARAVQGVGAALTAAAGLTVLTRSYPAGRARHRALGAWGAVGGAAGAAGLVIGGVLTQALGWRSTFLINLPIGVIIVAGAVAAISIDQRDRVDRKLNATGALALTAAIGLLIFGLGLINDRAAPPAALPVTLAAAVAAAVIFAALERRTSSPVLPSRIFALPGVVASYLLAFTLNAVIAATLFFTTLFMQQLLRLGPLATGVGFLPNSVLVMVGAFLAGRLATRLGAWPILGAGSGVIMVGALVLATVRWGGDYLFPVLPGFALIGLGLGLAFTAVTIAATERVPAADQGTASGILNTVQQLGFAIGIALIVTTAQLASDPATGFSVGYLTCAAALIIALAVGLPLSGKTVGRGGTGP